MDTIKTNFNELLLCVAEESKGYAFPTAIKNSKAFFNLQSFYEVINSLIYFLNYTLLFEFYNQNSLTFKKKSLKLLTRNTVACANSTFYDIYFLSTPKKDDFEKVNI